MSLRGPKPDEDDSDSGTRQMSFRVPREIRDYLRVTKRLEGRDFTEILMSAALDARDLARELAAERPRMLAYATSQGLTIEKELGLVLARLVRKGLDAIEAEKKGGKR